VTGRSGWALEPPVSVEQAVRNALSPTERRIGDLQAAMSEKLGAAASGVAECHAEVRYHARKSEALWQSLSNRMDVQTERLVDAVDYARVFLGDRLTELKWVLEQQVAYTREIRDILLAPLATESRELFLQGVTSFDVGRFEDAQAAFGQAREADRTNYFVYQYLGMLSARAGRFDEATEHFRAAVTLAEHKGETYHTALACLHLCQAHRSTGDVASAVPMAEKAALLQPGLPDAHYELAVCEAARGGGQRAAAALQRAVLLRPAYWAGAHRDERFEPVREAVTAMLDALKADVRTRAQAAIVALLDAQHAAAPRLIRQLDSVLDDTMTVIRTLGEDVYDRYLAVLEMAADVSRRLDGLLTQPSPVMRTR
jgi:tetratricopeptide (TPR) repeat protein